MSFVTTARELEQIIVTSPSREALRENLSYAADAMGFHFYALSHHPRSYGGRDSDLRIHNYPAEWEESYDRRRLGVSDPIHRASHIWGCGFRWRDISSIIPVTERDDAMLREGKVHGIFDGYTVPANVPGEPLGSVTFAIREGAPFPEDMIFFAERFARVAFQTARTIDGQLVVLQETPVADRQLEIAMWVGRDKSDWEIAGILGLKADTVTKHVRALRQRLGGAQGRTKVDKWVPRWMRFAPSAYTARGGGRNRRGFPQGRGDPGQRRRTD